MLRFDMLRKAVSIGFQKLKMGVEDNMAVIGVLKLKEFEGLVNYKCWHDMIDFRTKHRKLKSKPSVWANKNKIYSAFDNLFEKFQKSILVISYRSDGIPSIDELIDILKKYKRTIHEIKRKDYKYALSTNGLEEVLLIGE